MRVVFTFPVCLLVNSALSLIHTLIFILCSTATIGMLLLVTEIPNINIILCNTSPTIFKIV